MESPKSFYHFYCYQPTYIISKVSYNALQWRWATLPEIKTASATSEEMFTLFFNILHQPSGNGALGQRFKPQMSKSFLFKSHWRLRTESHKQENSKVCSREPRFTPCFHVFSTLFVSWGAAVVSECWGVKVILTVYPSLCARNHSTFPLASVAHGMALQVLACNQRDPRWGRGRTPLGTALFPPYTDTDSAGAAICFAIDCHT